MRPLSALLPLVLLCCLPLTGIQAAEPDFPLTEDSKPQPGVAKGEMLKDTFAADEGSIFPGTQREYQVYIPHGLDRSQPAAFMVFQDGVIYQAPVAFDNLIAKKDIPPLIGIFVKPGVVPATSEGALPRFNRSHEYDSITDDYARFLLQELLPAIEKKHQLRLSTDPNDTAIAGNSSGGIAAFMVAWHRPDRFRRVFTGVGTYVGIHGGDRLAVLVRKFEPRPIRVFLQSGTGDNNLYCGDWWMANQMMERSFTWAGYEVNHAWGEGGHNAKHASQIFPEVLRWLWKDWQVSREIKANARGDSKWKGFEIFEPGSQWNPVAGLSSKYLDVSPEGAVSAAEKSNVRSADQKGHLFDQIPGASPSGGTTLSPDQTLLYATAAGTNMLYSHQIGPDHGLSHPQPFYMLETPLRNDDRSAPGGMCVDAEGRLYVATSLGIQVCDQAGRVNFIIPTPEAPTDVCFGGGGLKELHIACGGKIYKRPTKVAGVVTKNARPVKPAAPKL